MTSLSWRSLKSYSFPATFNASFFFSPTLRSRACSTCGRLDQCQNSFFPPPLVFFLLMWCVALILLAMSFSLPQRIHLNSGRRDKKLHHTPNTQQETRRMLHWPHPSPSFSSLFLFLSPSLPLSLLLNVMQE